jgi:hypothetical protein
MNRYVSKYKYYKYSTAEGLLLSILGNSVIWNLQQWLRTPSTTVFSPVYAASDKSRVVIYSQTPPTVTGSSFVDVGGYAVIVTDK